MSTDVLDPQTTDVALPRDNAVMPGFTSNANWELAQRVAKAFAASTLVPAQYQNNLPNCIIALEMSNRMGASPLMVMQNLYIVHGNPGWSSKFLIASFNQCGRFSALRYEWSSDRTSCRAWAIEKETGERIDGPMVSLSMAKDEGWSTKNGSKWKTMPELMLMYRSAAFLIRTYAPEISMGLQTDDEIIDITPSEALAPRAAKAAEIGALLGNRKPPADDYNYIAARDLIVACANRERLAELIDQISSEATDGAAKDALMSAYRQRDEELSEGA